MSCLVSPAAVLCNLRRAAMEKDVQPVKLTPPKNYCTWESAKAKAGVNCRFHDLRHTGCTRIPEAGVPFSVVATIVGWSPSTTVRMSRRYGHIGQTAQRNALNALIQAGVQEDGAQNWAHSQKPRPPQRAN